MNNQNIDIHNNSAFEIVSLLKERGLRLCTAESCTGGMLASSIVDVPGSSAVFTEGFITYSNEAKTTRLGVSADVLARFGAVSEQTAKCMAKGAAMASGADVAVSVTGIAGPSGGSAEKPVGLVYIGVYYKNKAYAFLNHFSGTRDMIRKLSAQTALNILRGMLNGREEGH